MALADVGRTGRFPLLNATYHESNQALQVGSEARCLGNICSHRMKDGAVAYNRGDYAAAMGLWLPLAEAGHADAQTMLGTIYEEGHGVSQDYAAAVTWYHRAADQGHSDAQFYLACMHDFGKGIPLDPAAAAQWLSKAADQGHTDAQFNLG